MPFLALNGVWFSQKQAQELSEMMRMYRLCRIEYREKLLKTRTKFWYPEEKHIIIAEWNRVIERIYTSQHGNRLACKKNPEENH